MSEPLHIKDSERLNLFVKLPAIIAVGSLASWACKWLTPGEQETGQNEGMFIPLPTDTPIELSVENQLKTLTIRYDRELDKLQLRKENVDSQKLVSEGKVSYTPVPFKNGQEIERWPGEILSTKIEKFKIIPEASSTGVGVLKTVWEPQNSNQWAKRRIQEGEVVYALRVSAILKDDMWPGGDFEINRINLAGVSRKVTDAYAIGEFFGDKFLISGYVPNDKVLEPA